MGRDRWKPNRISSSDRGRPDRFKLDQPSRMVLCRRPCTVVNCNPGGVARVPSCGCLRLLVSHLSPHGLCCFFRRCVGGLGSVFGLPEGIDLNL